MRSPGCWRFGAAVFDEAMWTLSVDGRRVAVEVKPLELLRELLRRDGAVATKSELLDAVWPDVAVVEASLPTAVAKLRRALGDDRGEWPIIETVPRIGYRLAVPAELYRDPPSPAAVPHVTPPIVPARRWPGRLVMAGAVLALVGGLGLAVLPWQRGSPAAAVAPARQVTAREVLAAVRRLDLARIDSLLARGWNPNTPLGAQRNTMLNTALETCEWNPGHEEQVVLVVRTLIDAGAKLDTRNYWGDTPYSIASARRYCGPDHPATRMIRMWCGDGKGGIRPTCLAHYVHQGEPAPGE